MVPGALVGSFDGTLVTGDFAPFRGGVGGGPCTLGGTLLGSIGGEGCAPSIAGTAPPLPPVPATLGGTFLKGVTSLGVT